MATKIPFSKLKLQEKKEVKTITIEDVEVEVKQYLSSAEKLNLITAVMDYVLNDNNGNHFLNPIKIDVYTHLEIIFRYTNLAFTDKQKEDIPKLYDLLETNGIIELVINTLPQHEYRNLIEDIDTILENYIKYQNSFLGVLEISSKEYKDIQLSNEKLQSEIANPQNLTLLKDIVNKIG